MLLSENTTVPLGRTSASYAKKYLGPSRSFVWVQVAPPSWDWATHGSPAFGPFHEMYTCSPSLLIARTGLSFHDTWP